jgi:hypothetical protein
MVNQVIFVFVRSAIALTSGSSALKTAAGGLQDQQIGCGAAGCPPGPAAAALVTPADKAVAMEDAVGAAGADTAAHG